MREIRMSGSEGGAGSNPVPTPMCVIKLSTSDRCETCSGQTVHCPRIEPKLRRREAGWRATERENADHNESEPDTAVMRAEPAS